MIYTSQTMIGKKSTVLEINTSGINKNEELTAFKALCKYRDYEVVGFSSNWVALMVPDLCA